jgi:hypothetical protein
MIAFDYCPDPSKTYKPWLMLTFEFQCAVDRAIMLRSKSMPHVDVKARIGRFYAVNQYTKLKKVLFFIVVFIIQFLS